MAQKLPAPAPRTGPGPASPPPSPDVLPEILRHSVQIKATPTHPSPSAALPLPRRNGQIKLSGRDNTQALLQSPSSTPSMFLRFADGQGVLLNVSTKNQIEVWDIDTRKLCYLHPFEKEITAIAVLYRRVSTYM